MKNPLTFRIESSLGAIFVSLLGLFFIGLLFIAMKNFNSDIDVLSVDLQSNRIVRVSQAEKFLIQEWIKSSDVKIPEGMGYNYLIVKYPDRPWLN